MDSFQYPWWSLKLKIFFYKFDNCIIKSKKFLCIFCCMIIDGKQITIHQMQREFSDLELSALFDLLADYTVEYTRHILNGVEQLISLKITKY